VKKEQEKSFGHFGVQYFCGVLLCHSESVDHETLEDEANKLDFERFMIQGDEPCCAKSLVARIRIVDSHKGEC